MKKILALFIAFLMLLSGCATDQPDGSMDLSEVDDVNTTSTTNTTTSTNAVDGGDVSNSLGSTTGSKTSGSSTTNKSTNVKTSSTTGKTTASKLYDEVKNVIRQEALALKLNESVLKNSIVSAGNQTRVANVIKKALRGEDVTIGFIGGSITAGSSASSVSKQYVRQFVTWWTETFPKCSTSFVNAGIGATDSLIGVHRAQADLLTKKPDLVIVEFACNDNDKDAQLYSETYEGLVRKILKQEQAPGVILLFLMDQYGSNSQNTHQPIGTYYDLPMISYRDSVWPLVQNKTYQWSDLSPDNVHPNDTGHTMISELLIYYINTVREKLNSISEKAAAIPSAKTANRYEGGVLMNNQMLTAKSLGSFTVSFDAFRQFPAGWTTNGGSEAIVFEIEDCSNLYILYKADKTAANGTPARVTVKVDGQYVGSINADNKTGWGDYAATFEALLDGQRGKHTLEIQVAKEGTFALLGIMKS